MYPKDTRQIRSTSTNNRKKTLHKTGESWEETNMGEKNAVGKNRKFLENGGIFGRNNVGFGLGRPRASEKTQKQEIWPEVYGEKERFLPKKADGMGLHPIQWRKIARKDRK